MVFRRLSQNICENRASSWILLKMILRSLVDIESELDSIEEVDLADGVNEGAARDWETLLAGLRWPGEETEI